ncbi:MAG: hypothetical protein UX13_C0049G0011 [Candidatus Woesebacteria bacterium GW2011_GWB1_45_5]|uniref:Uncharacterized protein n=1 Tax=Candidatus Woesebacteria bacterium GW2011_GWB1_45_5 TaxID=1618581 RepID=A0A0G1PUI2_9BACT|nr:MAG: hypothetical protein UX13_C0049G0011 [Candidatus Woesebacteria bacterium GW2011_GWB1_45_5]
MKITKFYLNKASYIAVDENGGQIHVEIDYWDGKFRLSRENRRLEKFASRLLKKKHRVNFVHKMRVPVKKLVK